MGGAVRDPTTPTDCPGVLLLDQCLPPDNQCQFILKPNRALLGQAPLMGETAAPALITPFGCRSRSQEIPQQGSRFISQLKPLISGILRDDDGP